VEHTKPAPDLLIAALHKLNGAAAAEAEVVLVGDSVWDCRAGANLHVPVVTVRTGGFAIDELREAGAVDVLTRSQT
jgi:phosphoglycolate phosphatase-like HAD superfamily hydrolase